MHLSSILHPVLAHFLLSLVCIFTVSGNRYNALIPSPFVLNSQWNPDVFQNHRCVTEWVLPVFSLSLNHYLHFTNNISKPQDLYNYSTTSRHQNTSFFWQIFHVWNNKNCLRSYFVWKLVFHWKRKSMYISTIKWLSIIVGSRGIFFMFLVCPVHFLTGFSFRSGMVGPYMASAWFTSSSVTEQLTNWLFVMISLRCW